MSRVAALLLSCIGACADDNGPRLDMVSPAASAVGSLVTITGRHLCGDDGNCAAAGGAIRIGLDAPVQATIVEYMETTALLRIPQITPVGRTVLVATVNERASNTLDFEVLP